jgi:endonuclease/exonuclease/phosphatase family metal-dependent hydrolase
MAILSRLSLRDATTLAAPASVWDRPRVLAARVQLGDGEVLAVCVHARAPLPIPFLHAEPRNRQLAALGGWVGERASAGHRIVAAGDFNAVSCRVDGLVDAAASLDSPARTWRPVGLSWMPGMLRLDRVFVSPQLVPAAASVACRLSTSDHCPVIVTLAL